MAAARYYLRLLVSRQAVLAPVLFYLAVVALDHEAPGLPLVLLVTGQAAALGLACAVAGTSLARARRPG
jgi:hypothetical protein